MGDPQYPSPPVSVPAGETSSSCFAFHRRPCLRKRYYIMFVARDSDGQLLKIPIPVHYLYMFVAGAIIGMLTITGMAGSYTRMLAKTLRFNQMRSEQETLKKNYTQLEKVAEAKETQVASLSSLASEVSALY